MIGKIPRKKIRFEVSLVEHCNINCHMCDHFSPIAEKEFLDIQVFENDMKRMSELFSKDSEYIYLMGGEPLLHPQTQSFFSVARKAFPQSNIVLYTNGILLPQQNDSFWATCRNKHISIVVTKYPIGFDYNVLQELADKNCIPFTYADPTPQKELRHIPFDLTGVQDKHDSFIHCSHANNCITLYHGNLYTCSIAPNIRHFNHYFYANLPVNADDSINIHQAATSKDVLLFLSQPISLCKYCYVSQRTHGHLWKKSAMSIDEWT